MGENEGRNIFYQQEPPRPTSSTSSVDAEFNLFAGCEVPNDIFQPALKIRGSSTTVKNKIKLEDNDGSEQQHHMINIEGVILSPTILKIFDVSRAAKKDDAGGMPIKSVERYGNILFAFNNQHQLKQWSKKKLKRKYFTPTVAHRYASATLGGVPNSPRQKTVVVGKRMGTPKGTTSDFITIENSCALKTMI